MKGFREIKDKKIGKIMKSMDDILRYLRGEWKMMIGRKEGINLIDI